MNPVSHGTHPRPTLVELLEPYNGAALARQLGVDKATVSAWRRRIARPTVSQLPRLADILRIDLAELTRIVAETRIEAVRAS